MAAWGVADYLARGSSARLGSLSTSLLVQALGLVVPGVYLAVWLPTSFRAIDWPALAALVPVVALFLAVGYGVFYTGLQRGSVSIVAAVASTWLLVTVALGVLLLGESVGGFHALLIGLGVAGVALLSLSGGSRHGGRTGAGWGMLTMLAWGTAFAALEPITAAGGPALGVFLVRAAGSLGFWAFMRLGRIRVVSPKDGLGWRLLLATALLDALGFVAYNVGLERASLAFTAPLAAGHPLVTALLAWAHLRERLSPMQKAGILLTVGSIVALSAQLGA
jgi:drug/metabolite transporter (DMT)-like permease